MPFNVMLQLCRITRASKLFQRNFYLPLLKPLSPKDALRRHIITGKNLLGSRIEHYIPVLEEFKERQIRKKYRIKIRGRVIKRRQRKKQNMRYVMPFFDDEMEGHNELKELLAQKPHGKGQCYTYYVPDKDCTLVVSYEMERAIREKQILDITMAQRSEKIVLKLANNEKVTLPLVAYDGNAPFYRGEGWTKKYIEEFHHHGKETMGLAKLFEAKEQGIEEWELEMMRLANKRKKKLKGEGTADWKKLMAAAAELIDWDKFEEEAKQIVEEVKEPVQDEPIAMAVDDMEKTKNVNEKLQNAGPEVLAKLPLMPEIPELVKIMPEGVFTELANVSGMSLQLPSTGVERFVAGQMVKSEEGEMFMPGQTLPREDGTFEYTPGFTIYMDNEVTLLPGLVMGDDPEKPMFLPGESAITETGELQFVETEDDVLPTPEVSSPSSSSSSEEEEEQVEVKKKPENKDEPEIEIRRRPRPPPKAAPPRRSQLVRRPAKPPPKQPEPAPVVVEESEEEVSEEEEEEVVEIPKPVVRKKSPEKFEYQRPKRIRHETKEIKRREKPPAVVKKSAVQLALEQVAKSDEPFKPYIPKKMRIIDMPTVNLEKDVIQQEKERVKRLKDKKSGEERMINLIRRDVLMKAKKLLANLPPAKYVPLEPVKKSEKLRELEASIKSGTFFSTNYKKYLSPVSGLYRRKIDWKASSFQFQNVFHTVGINRYKLWRSVY